jgi:hypothetical protein
MMKYVLLHKAMQADSGLKIAECITWIFAKEIRAGARAGQDCSEVDGFCDVRGHRESENRYASGMTS